MDIQASIHILWVMMVIVQVCIILLAVGLWRKHRPLITFTQEVGPPEPTTYNVEFGHDVIPDAEFMYAEVPVFIGDDREKQIGEATVFKDGNGMNALIEIYEDFNDQFRKNINMGVDGVSFLTVPEDDPRFTDNG